MKKKVKSCVFLWEDISKLWRIMRLTIFIFLISLVSVSGSAFSQQNKMSLKYSNVTLKEAFRAIEENSNYVFFYNAQQIPLDERISLDVEQKDIEDILNELFQDKGIGFKLTDRRIVLYPKSEYDVAVNQQESHPVKGTVTNPAGEPIPGTTVIIKGTMVGTVTDMDGNYDLAEVDDTATLVFTFVGMSTLEVPVDGQLVINASLQEDAIGLEEVVAIGYGTQKKSSVTGSIATTEGTELAKVPTSSVSNTLAGRLPGLITYTRSGEPGYDDAGLLIRGVSTTGDSSPLVVVDGVADRAGGFSRIDPNDIESITILKDASAAIYGSRAANGVILVTTKRGKTDKMQIRYTGNFGSSKPTILPEMASSWEYAKLRNEIRSLVQGVAEDYTSDEIELFKKGSDPLNFPNIDVFDDMLRPAFQTQHNISLSGQSKKISYYTSVGYQYQDNYYKNSASNYNQYNLRSNIDITPNDNTRISVNLAARQEDRNAPIYGSQDIWRYMIKYDPTVNIRWPGTDLPTTATQDNFNPITAVSDAMGYTDNKASYFNTDFTVHLEMPYITEGLSIDGGAYVDRSDFFYKQFQKQFYLYEKNGDVYTPRAYGPSNASLNENMNQNLGLTFNARLNYARVFHDIHSLSAFVAYEQYSSRYDYLSAYRQDFVSTFVDELLAGTKDSQANDGTASETARQNYFGRVDYQLKERYLLQFNWRYDGSENFPKDNRFGFFPGVSLGWRVSEENFWKEHLPAIDYLKLRASWGQMGNDNVAAFQYLTTYTFSSAAILGGTPQTGVWLNRTANPNITWEVANTFNAGLDAKFLNKFNLEMDVFKTKRDNILATRNAAVPSYAGLSLPDENIGKCSSWGTEIVLGYNNRWKDFGLNLSGNFSYAHSRIDFIDEPKSTLEWQKRTGKSIGTDGSSFLMYEADGIFRTQEELDVYPHLSNTTVGDLRFKDVNNDEVIDARDKVRQDKPAIPEIMYGINATVSYKNWDLSMLWQGAARVWQYTFMEAGIIGNFTKDYYDNRWTPDNTNAPYPKVYNRDATPTGGGDYRNTFWLDNASYLRLKNIALSYSLPKSMLERLGMDEVRFSVSGYNLLTFTGIKNIDPETTDNSQGWSAWNTPQSKVINLGINLTF